MHAKFEIITADGSRFRCETANHYWQYGLVSGTIDTEDKTVVEVYYVTAEDEMRLIKTFSQVIAAGFVTDETLLEMPKEKRLSKCPQCAYTGVDNEFS